MNTDVIILGAGPAGSTAAALLAEKGLRVTVLEKEIFPRFHIGESLLPRTVPIMKRVGIDPSGFLLKEGAEFIDESTGDEVGYPFRTALDGGPPTAFQVDRATFDHALATAAQKKGASVRFGEKALKVDIDDSGVTVDSERDGQRNTYRARYVIDATGQDAFFGRRDRTIASLGDFGKAAVFTHFHGVADRISELFPTGNIKVLIIPNGWAWVIPLAGGTVSVGLVSRTQGFKKEWLEELIASSPVIQRLSKDAKRGPTRIIRNFSYKNRVPCGSRYACIGDASAFLDPVFSSGVTLAMESAERISELLVPALAEGREGDPELASSIYEHMRMGYVAMGSLIHSFYNRNLVRNIFFAPDPDPEYRAGLVSLLAGDMWREDNRFHQMLMNSSRRLAAIAELAGEESDIPSGDLTAASGGVVDPIAAEGDAAE